MQRLRSSDRPAAGRRRTELQATGVLLGMPCVGSQAPGGRCCWRTSARLCSQTLSPKQKGSSANFWSKVASDSLAPLTRTSALGLLARVHLRGGSGDVSGPHCWLAASEGLPEGSQKWSLSEVLGGALP